MERITSKENPRVKQLARILSDKGERERAGCFVAEGVKLCMDALDSGVLVREAFATSQALEKRPELLRLIDRADAAFEVGEAAASKISDTKSPQGVFALCEKRAHKRPEAHAPEARYLLLASLQDPGNVGAIIRTAEAFGMEGIALSPDCPELYSPKVLRSSMGGVFRLNIWIAEDMLFEVERLKGEGVTVYAATPDPNALKLGGLSFRGVCAALLGNEGAGLGSELTAACQAAVTIPMNGRADSLGVAAAAGILAWEMKKA